MGTKYQKASSLYMEDNWKRWQNQKGKKCKNEENNMYLQRKHNISFCQC